MVKVRFATGPGPTPARSGGIALKSSRTVVRSTPTLLAQSRLGAGAFQGRPYDSSYSIIKECYMAINKGIGQ